MTIPTYRLPPHVEQGARGGPSFMTVIQEAVSGKEQRIRQWAKCRAKYDISYGISNDDLADVQALFLAHIGKLHPFRFKDWADYQATDVRFGTGDGSETEFQLTKTYDPGQLLLGSPGSLTYVRTITCVSGTPVIEVAGSPTTDYTLSGTGLVTFNTPPANNDALTWTGEFDIPVRFDTDHLAVSMILADMGRIPSIPLIEVIGE